MKSTTTRTIGGADRIDGSLWSAPGISCILAPSAAAIALPDAEIGNRLFAFATLAEGSQLTAEAILARFLRHAIRIPITGPSYRVKDSLPPENKKTEKPNGHSTAEPAS